MRFSQYTLTFILAVSAPLLSSGFVQNAAFSRSVVTVAPAKELTCTGAHTLTCQCGACNPKTALRMSDAEEPEPEAEAPKEEIPVEVVALDGVESEEEAHNVERPARASGTAKHTKKDNGTPLSELKKGAMIEGTVKSTTSYGAFLDIGATTDALLHISRLSDDFVANVEDVVKAGQKVTVRIVNVDAEKKQVSVSLRSEEADSQTGGRASGGGGGSRPRRSGGDRAAQLKAMQSVVEAGFDTDKFIEGEVQSTLDFGAFVRFAVGDLGEGLEGEIDGLVHISALAVGRVENVNQVCKPGDKVQVRVKGIDAEAGKVSLSMITAAEEPKPRERGARRARAQFTEEELGPKDWKEKLETFQGSQPSFKNTALIVDMRK